jgi:outer membrane protein
MKTVSLYKYILLLVGCLALGRVHAACEVTPDMSRPLFISELLDIALQNNPETRTAWWNAQRASALTDLATSAYYPNVAFHADIIHGRDYKFINSDETNYTLADANVILNYLLYDFGERRATSDAAKAALCAANWQADFTLQRVLYNVVNNTYVYLNAQEQLMSRLQSLQDVRVTLDAAEDLYRVGLRSVNDVYTMRASISDMQMSIALQKAEVQIARGKLAASLGLNVDAPIAVAQLPDPQPDRAIRAGLDCLISSAYQKRADLMAKRSELVQKSALREKTRTSYLPKISFNAETGYKRYFHEHADNFNYNVGLNFDVPLFTGFESIYKNRLAMSDLQITETELERLELDIALEVLTYSHLFEAAEEVLQLANVNLDNSIKTFEGILEKYKAGTQSIFDLTAAQKQLAEARLKHGDAKTRWYRSLAQLAYATGAIMGEECNTAY